MNRGARARIGVVCAIVALIFTVFSVRLVDLQVAKHEEYSRIAAEKHTMRNVIHARRGLIFDRNGELLASNLPVYTVVADGSHIKNPAALAKVASPFLGISESDLTAKFATDRKYLVVCHGLPDAKMVALVKAMQTSNIRGLYFEPDTMRIYPNGSTLGHVLGFLDHEGNGIQGVEMTMNSYLRGKDGFRFIEHDRTGKEILLYRGQEQAAENGLNVHLTIDMGLQAILEDEIEAAFKTLKPEMAVAILMDPKTGEILALTNRPTFDPNSYNSAKPDQLKNHAIIDQIEPGSTFKIVVASAALTEGKVKENTTIFCEGGSFSYGGHVLHDTHSYGAMNVHDILMKSSNIGSAKMGLMLGQDKFYEYVKKFGFGDKTGIELPGEIHGSVMSPSRWDKLTITRMPMGQSIAATPLQISMGMSVIANGGKLMEPHIVRAVKDSDGHVALDKPPKVVRDVVPHQTASFVRDALADVVSQSGTAPLAKIEGFRVAGKTGTAQKVSPRGGYFSGHYVASFVGFLPVENPRFVCLVLFDDPKVSASMAYGGLVAAPIFSRIGERSARYLDLVPAMRAEAVASAVNTPRGKLEQTH